MAQRGQPLVCSQFRLQPTVFIGRQFALPVVLYYNSFEAKNPVNPDRNGSQQPLSLLRVHLVT